MESLSARQWLRIYESERWNLGILVRQGATGFVAGATFVSRAHEARPRDQSCSVEKIEGWGRERGVGSDGT